MVPISRSRTIASAVSSNDWICKIAAIRAGIIYCALLPSGLYKNLRCVSMGSANVNPPMPWRLSCLTNTSWVTIWLIEEAPSCTCCAMAGSVSLM